MSACALQSDFHTWISLQRSWTLRTAVTHSIYTVQYSPSPSLYTLGHIDYRPPQNTNCACSVLHIGVWVGLTQTRPRPAMCLRYPILTITYIMNMFITLTACRDRKAKIWRPKSIIYFSCALQPGTTHNAQIFNIISQANASSDERT